MTATLSDPAVVLSRYQAAFSQTWADNTPVRMARFVAFDTETTGLNTKHDTIVSIGAVSVQDGEILLGHAFETLLKLDYNSAMVVIHGITRDESQSGLDEKEALLEFLDYLGDGVIVGHHVGYDVEMLNEALHKHFGITLRNRFLDTMWLTLHLEKAGLLQLRPGEPDFSLDGLCVRFGIPPHDRHTAHGDAFLTAQIFLKLTRLAARAGRTTLGSLCESFRE